MPYHSLDVGLTYINVPKCSEHSDKLACQVGFNAVQPQGDASPHQMGSIR